MNLGQLVGEMALRLDRDAAEVAAFSLRDEDLREAQPKQTLPPLEADPEIKQMKKRRDRILAALEKFGPLKSVEIAQRIGETSKGAMSVELVHMKDCGLIETEGTAGRYVYRVVQG